MTSHRRHSSLVRFIGIGNSHRLLSLRRALPCVVGRQGHSRSSRCRHCYIIGSATAALFAYQLCREAPPGSFVSGRALQPRAAVVDPMM